MRLVSGFVCKTVYLIIKDYLFDVSMYKQTEIPYLFYVLHQFEFLDWFVVSRPSQQLWSCQDGQFSLTTHFLGKLIYRQVVNQYSMHILWQPFLVSRKRRMTVENIYDQSPRKYGAGLVSNSRPLDQQSDLLLIALQGLTNK